MPEFIKSHEFYNELKKLIPGIPDNFCSMKIILNSPKELVIIEGEVFVEKYGNTEVEHKTFKLCNE